MEQRCPVAAPASPPEAGDARGPSGTVGSDDTGLVAEGVTVEGPQGTLLAETSLRVRPREVVLVTGPAGSGHTALSLCLAGRMRPTLGGVRLDGDPDRQRLRSAVAIVDCPGVSEPDAVLPLRTVVGEELSIAGRRPWPPTATGWLAARGMSRFAGTRFERVPAPLRVGLLTELAATRPGAQVLVVTAPDRHGGTPTTWWQVCAELATTGLAVVVTCSPASAQLLGLPAVRLGGGQPLPAPAPQGRHARPEDPTTPLPAVVPVVPEARAPIP